MRGETAVATRLGDRAVERAQCEDPPCRLQERAHGAFVFVCLLCASRSGHVGRNSSCAVFRHRSPPRVRVMRIPIV